MQYSMMLERCQEEEAGWRLEDGFPWQKKKIMSARLAHLYEAAGYKRYAVRAASCASLLGFSVAEIDGAGQVEEKKTLTMAQFCRLRLCPMCAARRAKRAAILLSCVLDEAQRRERGLQYIFLTLTVKNVEGKELSDGLDMLTRGWTKLCKQRPVKKATLGWFRALEITRNSAASTYHPHIHAILAVPEEYWMRKGGLYITHEDWAKKWKLALDVSYTPSVYISSTHDRAGRRATAAAAKEAAKYATKSVDWQRVDEKTAIEIVAVYTRALYHRRLAAYGGLLRRVARDLKADDLENGDLIHLPDENSRNDLTELMEIYGWNWKVKDYFLEAFLARPTLDA